MGIEEVPNYSGGKYIKQSAGEFNALVVVDNTTTLTKKEKKPTSFSNALTNLIASDDFKNSKALAALSKETYGTIDWKDAVTRAGDEAVSSLIESAAAGAGDAMTVAATSYFGPVGGAITKLGTDWLNKTVGTFFEKEAGGRTRDMHLSPGQWVYINDGKSTHRAHSEPVIVHMEDAPLTRYEFSGDAFGMRRRMLKFKEEEADDISIGFYVGSTENLERVNVFSLKRLAKEYRYKDDVRAVEIATAKILDSDPIAQINQLYFKDFDNPDGDEQLYTGVSTDPGAEVIYKNEIWNIVQTNGSIATIEDEIGSREMVSLDKLDPGRSRNDTSWNYGSGFKQSFLADGAANLFSGAFIWVPSRTDFKEFSEWEMACVRNLAAKDVHACVLIDGEYIVTTKSEVFKVESELYDTLMRDKNFIEFSQACARGQDCTHVVQFDEGDYMMLLGLTEVAAAQICKFPTREAVKPVISEKRRRLVGTEDAKKLDQAEHTQTLENTPMQQSVVVDRETAQSWSAAADTGAGGLGIFAVVALVAFLCLNSS